MSEFEMPKKFKNPKKNGPFKQFFIMIFSFLLAGFIGVNLYLTSLPPIQHLEDFKPNVVTKLYSADGEVIKTFTAYKFEKVDIKNVPDDIKNAIIATEDKNFYHHRGYDPIGLARSMVVNISTGSFSQGASTITQQLARILFLSNEKTFDRKIKEFIVAARIEKTISKDQILEMYLNNVYLGSGAYGIAGAAQIYFNKPLKDLTLAESALIAGLPQAPSVYSPYNDKKLAIERRNQVLGRMYKMRYITRQQYDAAKEEKLHLNPNPDIYSLNRAPYFVDYAMKELEELGFDETEISQGGYKVVTTLNYKAQKAAEDAVIKHLGASGKNQAAVFSFSPITGEIFVYIGGKNYNKSQYDRVTQSVRPPGSAFKPLVYAAAIEKGWGPNDMLEDTPVNINGWKPHNYGNRYRGQMPLFMGLMLSSNVMAARLIQDVGVRSVIGIARSLGITTPIEYDMTIALGSNGVKLYEMTIAYGAFANGGFKVKPYSIERVETSRGKVIYQAPKTRVMKVLNLNTAAVITAMLETVIENGTGRAANIGKPAAAKTGTTDDNKDASFYGYTPDVVTGIWVGNDDNTKTSGIYGGTIPAMIWKETMKAATEKFGNSDFDYPEVELKKSAKNAAKTINPEDVTEEPPKPQMPSGDINGDMINNNPPAVQQPAQNPVSFNNTFLDPTAKPTLQPPAPPVPPIPKP
ncbi:MAG: PBP1A family penicillin-binding protein [Clostridium sp.]|nr:PBP1A family penicillin-binding protein [Clostridium sp.]